jgi:hypothetical protein
MEPRCGLPVVAGAEDHIMRGTALLGVILIVLGIAGLAFEHFSYTDTKPVLKAGPIQVDSHEEHQVSIPLIGSIVVLVVGAGLVVMGRRTA